MRVSNNVIMYAGISVLPVWTHRTNPSGLFASWNPRVHC
jgi:hypothetical protein